MRRSRLWIAGGVACFAVAAGFGLGGHRSSPAADHFDPPARVGTTVGNHTDPAADIADLYAFFDAQNLYVALAFGGPTDADRPAFYDRNVLYTINLSNDGNRATTEFPIEVRFGFDGQFPGVRVSGLPQPNNATTTVTGPVETNITAPNGLMVRAGLFDDPFFFDQQGFNETRQTGTIRFNNQRNIFAGRNDTFVVLQIPRAIINRNQPIDLWATTARIGS